MKVIKWFSDDEPDFEFERTEEEQERHEEILINRCESGVIEE